MTVAVPPRFRIRVPIDGATARKRDVVRLPREHKGLVGRRVAELWPLGVNVHDWPIVAVGRAQHGGALFDVEHNVGRQVEGPRVVRARRREQ